jgi:hypothetical protein
VHVVVVVVVLLLLLLLLLLAHPSMSPCITKETTQSSWPSTAGAQVLSPGAAPALLEGG